MLIISIIVMTTMVISIALVKDDNKITNEFEYSFKRDIDKSNVIIISFDFLIKNKKKELSFILDTGSMKNIIASDILSTIDKKDETNKTFKSNGCNGIEKDLKEFYIEFYFKNCLFIDKFIASEAFVKTRQICKNEYGLEIAGLIGMSFMRETNSIIDFKTKKLKFHGRDYKIEK